MGQPPGLRAAILQSFNCSRKMRQMFRCNSWPFWPCKMYIIICLITVTYSKRKFKSVCTILSSTKNIWPYSMVTVNIYHFCKQWQTLWPVSCYSFLRQLHFWLALQIRGHLKFWGKTFEKGKFKRFKLLFKIFLRRMTKSPLSCIFMTLPKWRLFFCNTIITDEVVLKLHQFITIYFYPFCLINLPWGLTGTFSMIRKSSEKLLKLWGIDRFKILV